MERYQKMILSDIDPAAAGHLFMHGI